MNLDDLHTFLEIINRGSLSAASSQLHVTPSTVTARINALEAQLGCQLLHRNKSGAELTAAGFKLQRYAELMTQLWRQARHELALPPGVISICNVGIAFDLWHDVGNRFLAYVRAQSPGVATAVWPAEDRQLQRWLSLGLVDIAFCYSARAETGYASRLLFEDELVMVSGEPGATAEIGTSYVYVDHGDEFRRQHVEAFLGAGPSLLTIAASDWALEYLQQRRAKGYLPQRIAAPLLRAGRLHRVEAAPTFSRSVYLVESVRAVRSWHWYEAAVAAARPT